MNRRHFLQTSASALALPASLAANNKAPLISGQAEHVISIWLGGGMGQTDTFDPKRKGDPSKKTPGSYYDPIDTAVPGNRAHVRAVCAQLAHWPTDASSPHRVSETARCCEPAPTGREG